MYDNRRALSLIVLLLVASVILGGCQPAAEPEVMEEEVTAVPEETEATSEAVPEEEVTAVPEETEATSETVSEEPEGGGVLRYGLFNDPQNWTPYNVISCQNEVVMAQIWSGLVRYNAQGDKLVGDLAESWEWVDDTTVVFHLRENVTWHNGDPLVADHVVKSMELRTDPSHVCIEAPLLEDIEEWEAVDDYTVRLTLKTPNIGILHWLTPVPGHGFVLHPDYDETTSGQSAETTVGTGPFMYESYEPGVAVKLARNPDYFIEDMPYLERLEFIPITDDEARLTALRSGEIDMMEYIDFQSMPVVRDDPNLKLTLGEGFYGCREMFDFCKSPTDDVNVRHALSYAVDRQMILDAAVGGEGAVCWGSIIPEGSFGYAPELADYYSYDPEKAVELLAEAGWTDTDGDGILDKDGQALEIKFMNYGPSWWSQAGEIIQENFRAIGIECELEVLPWADYRDKRAQFAELPAGEPSEAQIWASTLWGLTVPDFANYIAGGYNLNRYDTYNPELVEEMAEVLATTDDAAREELFREAQAMVMEDAPWIAPVWISRGEAMRDAVQNFEHYNNTGCYGTLLWQARLDTE